MEKEYYKYSVVNINVRWIIFLKFGFYLNITMDNINWTNITNNEKVIELLKELGQIEKKIQELDEMALVKYELERLELNESDSNHVLVINYHLN